MKVRIRRLRGAQFEAESESGQRALIDGPKEIGGQGEGVRPMELVLMGLAGCSAVDVVMIMEKQRQALEDLEVFVEGTRADSVPKVFTAISVRFEATGSIEPAKLQRAVDLSMEKYCSVAKMLEATASITWSAAIRGQ